MISYPFVEVCVLLGLPPVLTAAATDLWNWKLVDESKPISLSNLTSITTMTGTSTEISFHMTPCIMQVLVAPLIMKIYNGPDLIKDNNVTILKNLLDEISDAMEDCRQVIFDQIPQNYNTFYKDHNLKVLIIIYFSRLMKVFSSVGKNVDPVIFYHVQRPLLAGFYPENIILLDTEDIEKPVDWVSSPKGPSAGQSTIFVLLDNFLGIDHGDVAKEFQEEMIHYMPRQHKHMVLKFKEKLVTSVRHFIMSKYCLTKITFL